MRPAAHAKLLYLSLEVACLSAYQRYLRWVNRRRRAALSRIPCPYCGLPCIDASAAAKGVFLCGACGRREAA